MIDGQLPQMARGEIGFRIKELFFDRDLVTRDLDEHERKVLSRFGYFVMRDARQSIRRPRRKRLNEMSPAEAERYAWTVARAKAKGQPRPKRPFAPSDPGTTPRNLTGRLRSHIYFMYERLRRSIVVGPALLAGSSGAPETLEHGGQVRSKQGQTGRIRPRPYMLPAFQRQMTKRDPVKALRR